MFRTFLLIFFFFFFFLGGGGMVCVCGGVSNRRGILKCVLGKPEIFK